MWLTPLGVVWETWRGMGWTLAVSWVVWIWASWALGRDGVRLVPRLLRFVTVRIKIGQ
jgi:hypothetical protein